MDPTIGQQPATEPPGSISGPPVTIAIDGPAASGKSTIGDLLAQRLGFLFFDTGLMYRAVTWIAQQQRAVPVSDEAAVTLLAETVPIDVQPPTVDDGRQSTVVVEGHDITWLLREPAVNADVSVVAAYGGVRDAMVIQQRRIGLRGQIVMVGRDIGTVVLPEADLKVFLVASAEERARRRWAEEQQRNGTRTLADVLAEIRRRDDLDSNRAIAPLRPAAGALIVDSTGLTPDQVVEQILQKGAIAT